MVETIVIKVALKKIRRIQEYFRRRDISKVNIMFCYILYNVVLVSTV